MQDGRKIDRTWLCSVLFFDIVDYSSQPVSTQLEWKAFFNQLLSEALAPYTSEDRIVIDTGDGAIVCFLGEPEAALLCTLPILNGFLHYDLKGKPAPAIRAGINLGPIRLVTDINGNRNALGDGINVGQRIMSFAQANQLLISRSYYEVVSTLAEDYRQLFRFDGVRQDKHIREHTVYAYVSQAGGQGMSDAGSSPFLSEAVAQPQTFPTDQLRAIEVQLAGVIGPIAGHMIREATRKAKDVPELCSLLAQTCVPEPERSGFLERCGRIYSGPPAKPAETLAVTAWDARFLERLRKELAEHLGPIARIVVESSARRAQTREALVDLISENIKPEKDRERFRRRVL